MTQLNKMIGKRWVQHLLFWALSFYLLLRFFAYDDIPSLADLAYTALFHLSLLVAVYANLLLLIPRLLSPGRYAVYAIALSLLMVASASFNMLTFRYLSDWLFPGFYFISYYDYWDIFQFVLVYVVLTTLLKLSKAWFSLRETQRELDQLQREQLNTEIEALRSQINPHFLFNNLHNLYSLSLDGDARTPDLILRLSQGMRYVLYESSEDRVPLQREVAFLEDMIELQRLRSEESVRITFEVKGDTENKQIAPLLFLPLVENAFKHGLKAETLQAYAHINLEVEENGLLFQIQNNTGERDEASPENYRGIGLTNLRRRLELLYPGRHRLDIREGESDYRVSLKIEDL